MMLPDPEPDPERPARWRTCSYADGMELWSEALESTELSPAQRQMLRHRVMNASCRLKASVVRLGRLYRSMKIIVTAGALLVPSLSALNMGQPSGGDDVFWLIWVCGLGTSFCNAFVSLFGVDRKYFVQKEQLSRLESEAWLFVGCAGRYRTDGGAHAQHLAPFVERVEFILQKASREMPHPEGARRGDAPSEPSERPRTPPVSRAVTLGDRTPSA